MPLYLNMNIHLYWIMVNVAMYKLICANVISKHKFISNKVCVIDYSILLLPIYAYSMNLSAITSIKSMQYISQPTNVNRLNKQSLPQWIIHYFNFLISNITSFIVTCMWVSTWLFWSAICWQGWYLNMSPGVELYAVFLLRIVSSHYTGLDELFVWYNLSLDRTWETLCLIQSITW